MRDTGTTVVQYEYAYEYEYVHEGEGEGSGTVRFVLSPLRETWHSLWTLRDPGHYPHHLPWLRRLRTLTPRLDTDLLVALTGDGHRLPRFLTAGPRTRNADVRDELSAVRRADPAEVLRDLGATHRDARPPAVLRGDATALHGRLVTALETYWTTVMEPYWPRIRAVLEADVPHRARVLAARGTAGLVASLHPGAEWDAGALRLSASGPVHRLRTAGPPVLCPSVFALRATVPDEHASSGTAPGGEGPRITYPARGAAALWDDVAAPTPEALTDLIGRAKTTLLTTLSAPETTVALARSLGVSPSAVSQHLARLAACGLVTRRREGRTVLYLRSELGDRLVGRRTDPRTA
ncbi:MarR family transcriptional regulator [Streptomyces griseoviridis]|uniref:helix-turn-helix domain-containing protein n=1 Tax=Streptomyces griseoviridis TaxID=45398 RepID=UPI001671B2DC|nr:MarR family transcriptional regulator [Streptomyces niveoruber]